MKKTELFLFAIILGSLFVLNSKQRTVEENVSMRRRSIELYPGYLAKSRGRIRWFPEMPEYKDEGWTGDGTDITGTIADPWPQYEGDGKSVMQLE